MGTFLIINEDDSDTFLNMSKSSLLLKKNVQLTTSSSSSGVDDDNDVNAKESECIECKEEQNLDQQISKQKSSSSSSSTVPKQTEEQSNESYDEQSRVIPSIFYKHHHVSIEYSTGSSIDSSENALYKATYYANELLSMIYERNAWWKKKQQQEPGGEVTEDDVGVDGDDDVPAAVDSVTLIPNRLENGILVRSCWFMISAQATQALQ